MLCVEPRKAPTFRRSRDRALCAWCGCGQQGLARTNDNGLRYGQNMGAWDATPFGNDHANDWAYGLDEVDDLSLIDAAFKAVSEGYIESSKGDPAVAAAEVLTWLIGRPGERNAYTEKIATWSEAHPIEVDNAIIDRALAAMQRVLSPDSELVELWDGQAEWRAGVEGVMERLRPGSSERNN